MGKRMKLPFLSHSKSLDPNLLSSPAWPWPSCGSIKTLSFRATNVKVDAFRTYNSAFLDTQITPPDSFFTVSSSSRSFSTMSEEDTGDPVENVIRGLSSDRLFFEPEKSSSLVSLPLEAKNQHQLLEENDEQDDEEYENEEEGVAYKESELLSMESNNPYEDFRRSMEEMVEAHGLKDWQGLEELLRCYLKVNGKNNHGYIVGAFIDLLVRFSFVSSPSNSTSTSSSSTTITSSSPSTCLSSSNSNNSSPSSPLSLPSSSLTTPCLSSVLDEDHHHDDNDNDDDNGNDGNHGDDDDSSL